MTPDEAPPQWDARVAAAGGMVFHGTPFARVIVAQGRTPWYLEFRAPAGEHGFGLAEMVRSRLPLVGRARSRIVLQTAPVLPTTIPLGAALHLVRELARKEGIGRAEFSSYGAVDPAATAVLRKLGWPARRRLEFLLPLGPDLAATLEHMSAGHRRNIRKAMSAGFGFREDSSIEGAARLRRLQEATYSRRWEQGNTSPHPMEEAYYLRTVGAYLGAGAIRFWFVDRDGEEQSALGILVHGSRAYYLVGGTSEAGYGSRAAFAAFGFAIEALCNARVTELHLGGVPSEAEDPGSPDHGLYRFKAGFGAEPVSCWDAEGPA